MTDSAVLVDSGVLVALYDQADCYRNQGITFLKVQNCSLCHYYLKQETYGMKSLLEPL